MTEGAKNNFAQAIKLDLTFIGLVSRGSEWGGGGGSTCRWSVKIQLLCR